MADNVPGEIDEAQVVAKKMANALFSDAKMSGAAGALGGMPARGVVGLFKKAMGGLWVGGTVYLMPDRLCFRANLINRLSHVEDHAIDILLADISGIEVRKATVTDIVDVTHAEGKFSFRCYGAQEFADNIKAQMAG